jgi:hypothetical protein
VASSAAADPDGMAKRRDHWDHRASREASETLARGALAKRSGPIDACQQRAKSASRQMASTGPRVKDETRVAGDLYEGFANGRLSTN